MSLTNFLGVLTLAPALFAVVIAVLGIARRPYPRVVLALACAGALIPAISLLLLAPDLSSGVPIPVALFGGIAGSTMNLSAGYRLDTFGLYAAFGLVFLVTPLLLWTAWQSSSIRHTDTDTAERMRQAQIARPTPWTLRLMKMPMTCRSRACAHARGC